MAWPTTFRLTGTGLWMEASEKSSRSESSAPVAPVSPSPWLSYPPHLLQESLLPAPSCRPCPGVVLLCTLGRLCWPMDTGLSGAHSQAGPGLASFSIAMPAASSRVSWIPNLTSPAPWNASTHPAPARSCLLLPCVLLCHPNDGAGIPGPTKAAPERFRKHVTEPWTHLEPAPEHMAFP